MPIPQGPELIIILVLVLVLFGTSKLGDVGGALGKSIREFRHAANDETNQTAKPKPAEDPAQPKIS